MRWPSANLEEKHEPRGVSVAEALTGDSMKSSGRNLTLAAIEKRPFVGPRKPTERPMAVIRRRYGDRPGRQSLVARVDRGMIRSESRPRRGLQMSVTPHSTFVDPERLIAALQRQL